MGVTPRRHRAEDNDLDQVLDLMHSCFAYMEGRIDPPSSLHRMSVETLQQSCRAAEVWSLGDPPFACMILTPQSDVLYLGKFCVAADRRGSGVARQMLLWAEDRCRSHGLGAIELQTRVELTENQQIFAHLGFRETGRTAHPGYDRPTSVTMRKPVSEG